YYTPLTIYVRLKQDGEIKDNKILGQNILGEKTIGGIVGKVVDNTTNGSAKCKDTIVYVKNLAYTFSDECGSVEDVFNSMLSTFKFTNTTN
ncbi:MAG: hypothetical protein ACHQVK_01115, partial [Candidatus Paceibacterales bacterium]